VDGKNQPDLTPLRKASETIGKVLKRGDVVVYESTVYPGVTEEICGPVLAKSSGLKQGADFKLGYSPERINPGDKERTLPKITKIVAGEDDATLERVADVYERIIQAGIFRAPTIKVAEAAKVTENIQRDINIGLMNELAVVFDKMGIRTTDVLAAAGTKWNFLKFTPGLVGGHCIGVDPYYLTSKSEEIGIYPEMILSARRRNNSIAGFIADKTVKMLSNAGLMGPKARVGVIGVTFKENVPDLRNSKVPDIMDALQDYGLKPLLADTWVNVEEFHEEYPKLKLSPLEALVDLDALILAVPHQNVLDAGIASLVKRVKKGGLLIDVKSALEPEQVTGLNYWSL
jgi:UDP-N-acetyl-D-galactosamine dehydrogenase